MDDRQVADLEQRSFSDAAAVSDVDPEPPHYLGVLGLTPPTPVLADEE